MLAPVVDHLLTHPDGKLSHHLPVMNSQTKELLPWESTKSSLIDSRLSRRGDPSYESSSDGYQPDKSTGTLYPSVDKTAVLQQRESPEASQRDFLHRRLTSFNGGKQLNGVTGTMKDHNSILRLPELAHQVVEIVGKFSNPGREMLLHSPKGRFSSNENESPVLQKDLWAEIAAMRQPESAMTNPWELPAPMDAKDPLSLFVSNRYNPRIQSRAVRPFEVAGEAVYILLRNHPNGHRNLTFL